LCGKGKFIANYGSHGDDGSGSLNDGGLTILYANNQIGGASLSESSSTTLPVAGNTITLIGSADANFQTDFKGFIFRLEA